MEDRPGTGRREHGRAEAGLDDPAQRSPLRRRLPAGRPAARRGQHRHGPGRDRHARRSTILESTRSPSPAPRRSARRSPRASPDRQGAHPRARRQGRQHRLRRRAARPGRRGHRQRQLLQPGRGLLRRDRAARPGVDPDGLIDKLKDRQGYHPIGDPLDKNTDVGASQLEERSGKITEASRKAGRPRAPSSTSRRATCRSAATTSGPPCSRTSPRAMAIAHEEIFGPVLSVLPTPDEAVEKANNAVYGLSAGDPDREGGRSCLWPAMRAGPLWRTVQPVRSYVAVRRLQGSGWARGWHPWAPRLRLPGGPMSTRRSAASSDGRNGDLALSHGVRRRRRPTRRRPGSPSSRHTSSTSPAISPGRSPAARTWYRFQTGPRSRTLLEPRKDLRDAVAQPARGTPTGPARPP